MTMQPTDTPVRSLPTGHYWAAWNGYFKRWYVMTTRDNSLSWGGAPLQVVDEATAAYIRMHGDLPKGDTHATE